MRLRENLDGWWHAFFDESFAWPAETVASGIPGQEGPSEGWDKLDDYKESVPVPGEFSRSRPGYRGMVWYHRPFVLPDVWINGQVWLECAVRSRALVYLDERLVSRKVAKNTVTLKLGTLNCQRVYNLCLGVWHDDDSGGIKSVYLVYEAN